MFWDSTLASQNVFLPALLQGHLFSNSWIARDQRSVVVLETKTRMPRKSKDQTLPIGSRESFLWITLKTILCLVLDSQGEWLGKITNPLKLTAKVSHLT